MCFSIFFIGYIGIPLAFKIKELGSGLSQKFIDFANYNNDDEINNLFETKKIGIRKPEKYYWLLIAFVLGLVASILLYFLGQILYGHLFENWYTYIGKSYNIPKGINANDKRILFIVMAVTGMIFSPIGEELFFRGIVHSSFEKSIGEKKASIVDSTAFALTHISHFGLVFINNQWSFFAMQGFIWVLSMFLLLIAKVKRI